MKRMKNGIIKEHIYSKGRKSILNSDGTNVFRCYEEAYLHYLKLDDTIWGKFIIDTIGLNKPINLPPEHNVKYIINEIPNKTTRNVVINYFFQLENYNPFENTVPLDKFPKNYQKLIAKKQLFIKENFDFFQEYEIEDKTLMVSYDLKGNNMKGYLNSYDVVVLFNSYSFYIATKTMDLSYLYEILNNEEPNKWILEKNHHRIYLKDEKRTKFYYPSINEYVIEILKESNL